MTIDFTVPLTTVKRELDSSPNLADGQTSLNLLVSDNDATNGGCQ